MPELQGMPSMLARKYDSMAEGFIEREYADPAAYFGHRLGIFMDWGPKPAGGDSVLHLGCGDGYFTEMLLRQGMSVLAGDFSQGMLDRAVRRCREYAGRGRMKTALTDINDPDTIPGGRHDHVVAVMRSFFTYSKEPEKTLRRIHSVTGKRFIADFNPREQEREMIEALMRSAGFRKVKFRAFLVPQKRKLPPPLLALARAAERIPLIYGPLTARKFHMWVMGEK